MLDCAAKDKQFGTPVKVRAGHKWACRGIALPRSGDGTEALGRRLRKSPGLPHRCFITWFHQSLVMYPMPK